MNFVARAIFNLITIWNLFFSYSHVLAAHTFSFFQPDVLAVLTEIFLRFHILTAHTHILIKQVDLDLDSL
jgi:hypothetical protein